MTEKEMFEQLEDLIVDRKSFISNDQEMNEMFINDVVALELIISKYKTISQKKDLQQLNENLKKDIENYINTILYQRKTIDKYQKRCEKAIKLIENCDYMDDKAEPLLSILQGNEDND